MRVSDIAKYMEWKDNSMTSQHPWFPKVVDDLQDDASLLDDTLILSPPPEFVLPEWDRPEEIPPWETHDYTDDYDYPDDYTRDDDEGEYAYDRY